MPPPTVPGWFPGVRAVFPESVLLVNVNAPSFMMAPPYLVVEFALSVQSFRTASLAKTVVSE